MVNIPLETERLREFFGLEGTNLMSHEKDVVETEIDEPNENDDTRLMVHLIAKFLAENQCLLLLYRGKLMFQDVEIRVPYVGTPLENKSAGAKFPFEELLEGLSLQ